LKTEGGTIPSLANWMIINKAGNQAINLLPVSVWFPKQAIKQSTCYQYLFGFQRRQSSN
jgi:hypothetical protein